jgi:hypothetical protein
MPAISLLEGVGRVVHHAAKLSRVQVVVRTCTQLEVSQPAQRADDAGISADRMPGVRIERHVTCQQIVLSRMKGGRLG